MVGSTSSASAGGRGRCEHLAPRAGVGLPPVISPGALRGGPGHPVTGCCHRTDCRAELPAVSHGPWGPLRADTRSSTKDPRAGQEPVCRNPGPRSQTPTLPGDHQPSRGRPWDGRHGRGGPCSGGVACSGRHDWGQTRGGRRGGVGGVAGCGALGVAGAWPEVGAGPGRTDLVVAMHQDDAQVGGLEPAPALHDHVVALADVVDVHGDAGVRPWAQHGLGSPSARAAKPASQPRAPERLAGLPRTVPRTRRGGSGWLRGEGARPPAPRV